MDGLSRNSRELTAAEAFAGLRIGGVIVIAVAVLLGPTDPERGFALVVAAAAVYSAALTVLAVRGRRGMPPIVISLADVGFVLLLVGFSGGALSDARLALAIYPVAMGLAHTGRAIAVVTAVAAAGFTVVSFASLDESGAPGAFVETLGAMVIFGAIGVALATAFQRSTRQIEELASGRAALLARGARRRGARAGADRRAPARRHAAVAACRPAGRARGARRLPAVAGVRRPSADRFRSCAA